MSDRRFVAGLAVILVVLGALTNAHAEDEGELLRRIKSDVFDQNWSEVLASCDAFIESFPRGQALPRIYYYRAQALESMRRPEEAIAAYSEFLKRFPAETGAIKEDALLRRITLARQLYQRGAKGHLWVLIEGMDMQGYPRIYAAIEVSKIDHRPAQRKAIPILKDCASNETQDELKSECVVALVRIDPDEVPESAPKRGDVASTAQVKLIKLEIFDKRQGKVSLMINLPIAFAEILLDSLSAHYREAIQRELFPDAPETMPDLKEFWKTVKESGPQTLVEIDNQNERIRVWIE